ncbi:hypothetical protein CYMTET_11128, partial [Cymbomonas tetramitiformis]
AGMAGQELAGTAVAWTAGQELAGTAGAGTAGQELAGTAGIATAIAKPKAQVANSRSPATAVGCSNAGEGKLLDHVVDKVDTTTKSSDSPKIQAGSRIQDDIFGRGTVLSLCCTHSLASGKCNSCTHCAFALVKYDSGKHWQRKAPCLDARTITIGSMRHRALMLTASAA